MDAANAPCSGATSGLNSRTRPASPLPLPKNTAAHTITMTRPLTSITEATRFAVNDSFIPRRFTSVSTAMNTIAVGTGGTSSSAPR
ncbi:hypothetical protein [Rathayibacter agropyri]|uniref:hypothetical protein n=1 Tax=Rathayibacter agropyri TaxID=1634927 RepID=UPI001CA3FE12|nr:hypothetical protein [Rathayibacter agropyri]